MVPGVNKRRAAGRELQPRSSVPRLAFFKQEAKDSRSSQMPSSDVSSGSSVSVHSKSRRYRTKALNSEVDETLFGSAVKKLNTVKEDDASEKEGPRQGKAASAPAGGQKEIIRIITKDLIRSLIVPTEDPSGKSVIITPQEYNRIRSAARFLTKEEREVAMQKMKEEKAEILDAVCNRKNHMKQQEVHRKKNEKLNEMEEEAKVNAQYLLEKAYAMRMEQEDEIKHVNELILNTKCHVIRDAQILEKKQIDKELGDEEMRLDQMMEVERQRAIQMQEEIEALRKQERLRGQLQLLEQIKKNQEEAHLNEEVREQETQQMLEYLEQVQLEDMKVSKAPESLRGKGQRGPVTGLGVGEERDREVL
nr:PREDICTED: cilia- and flagella-associated protein 45-like [Latimeria chalumnae]|eukprot:XP_014339681.1 PREDICTED: cilia- and flagella-associated protein 45-like [Latimeria chalumnae]